MVLFGLQIGYPNDTTSEIGVQKNKGNRWVSYRDTVGAVNYNNSIGGLFASLFRTSGNPSSVYYPAIPIWDNGWFFFSPGTEEWCGNTCNIHEIIDTTRDQSLEMSIALGTFESTEENTVVAEQYLFDLLTSDSLMLQSETVYEDFYDEHQSGTVGQINEVNSTLKSALQPDSIYYNSIFETDSIWNGYLADMQELDSLALANPQNDYSAQIETLSQQIIDVVNELKDLSIEQHETALDFIEDASILNNNISPDQLPQTNEKFINQINFQFITFGNDALVNYYNEILGVAEQCPTYGGPAVYRARTLLALLNDSLSFEDACSQYSSSRNQLANQHNKLTPKISIVPNPANNKINIILAEAFKGICQIEISNSLGESVLLEQKNCNDKSVIVSVSDLKPGVYSVKVLLGESASDIVKLVIAR